MEDVPIFVPEYGPEPCPAPLSPAQIKYNEYRKYTYSKLVDKFVAALETPDKYCYIKLSTADTVWMKIPKCTLSDGELKGMNDFRKELEDKQYPNKLVTWRRNYVRDSNNNFVYDNTTYYSWDHDHKAERRSDPYTTYYYGIAVQLK